MDFKETHYNYDPKSGHFDKNTNAEGFNYFFLGNGSIEVAIQYDKSGKGTPLGVAIMDPDKIGKKDQVFTFDKKYGLERTMVSVKIDKDYYLPNAKTLNVYWWKEKNIPTVIAIWNCQSIQIAEAFLCHSKDLPQLLRIIVIRNPGEKVVKATLSIDLEPSSKTIKFKKFEFDVPAEDESLLFFLYELDSKGNVKAKLTDIGSIEFNNQEYWDNTNFVEFNNYKLDHLFSVSKNQVAATISNNAIVDASVWQYNREWVRDLSNVALGSLYAGHIEVSKKIIQRLLDEFITKDGSSVDNSLTRPISEVELDQNGILLYAIWQYRVWTDDVSIIEKNWKKIKALAEFPLKDCFWDKKSHLLANKREYWERHDEFGVTNGYELTYQMFPVLGLEKAAEMADEIGEKEYAKRWSDASKKIWNAVLKSPKFAMIESGSFIKRREKSGKWHKKFVPSNRNTLVEGVPLREEINNFVDPDTSSVLPIVFNMIDAKSKLANKTLEDVEKLWNQRWNHGGYGRYNIQSEPDSPGPWPFATMFVTRAYFENENVEKVIRNINWMIDIGGSSGSWFEFYGWRPVPPLSPSGIVPWSWAEVLACLVHNMLGIRPEKDAIVISPKILDLTDKIESKFIIGGKEFSMQINTSPKIKNSYALLNRKTKLIFKNGQIRISKSLIKSLTKINLEIYLREK
jgi:hypothetical protein